MAAKLIAIQFEIVFCKKCSIRRLVDCLVVATMRPRTIQGAARGSQELFFNSELTDLKFIQINDLNFQRIDKWKFSGLVI